MEWAPVTAALQNISIHGCMSLFSYVFVTVRDLEPPNYLKLLDGRASVEIWSLGLTEDSAKFRWVIVILPLKWQFGVYSVYAIPSDPPI